MAMSALEPGAGMGDRGSGIRWFGVRRFAVRWFPVRGFGVGNSKYALLDSTAN
jgi:hypothetical protein